MAVRATVGGRLEMRRRFPSVTLRHLRGFGVSGTRALLLMKYQLAEPRNLTTIYPSASINFICMPTSRLASR
jgi:hypothetical protein